MHNGAFDLLDEVTAYASSSSSTAMSASNLPPSVTSVSSVETTPRTKFEPVGLVNTFSPRSESIEATMRVVVVLPFVPDTNTTPSGNCPERTGQEAGVNLFYDFAGQPNRHVW